MHTGSSGLRLFNSLAHLSVITAKAFFWLAVIATGLMLLPTLGDVLGRLISGRSLTGASELVELCLVVLVFASLPYLNACKEHIRVDLLLARFSRNTRHGLELGGNIAALLLFGRMGLSLWTSALNKLAVGETSLMLGLPLGWEQMLAVAGLVLLCFNLLIQAGEILREILGGKHWSALWTGVGLPLVLVLLPIVLQPLYADGFGLAGLGAWSMLFLLALLFLGLPIGMVMAGVGYLGLLVIYPVSGPANLMLGVGPFGAASNYFYTIIPMFILMGELALVAGISQDLFKAAALWMGRLPGGLAMASVAGCAGFAAVSGDSLATSMTMSAVALPEMERHKYDSGFACATLAAGGTLGILIPPSTGFIFYSLVTEQSVGRLFVAGIIPGILLTFLFILLIGVFARRHPELAPSVGRRPLREKLASLWGVVPMLALMVLIIGGILSGKTSPNEAGAIGAAATLLYALFRGRLTWIKLRNSLVNTTLITGRLLLILMGVGVLSAFMAATALPEELALWVQSINAPRSVAFACIILFYILLGCVMNVIPMILLTLPTLYPAVVGMGFDPIWFGVIVVIMMEMGQITPPVGLNVFGMAAVAKHVPMQNIFRHVLLYFLAMLLLVILLAVFPGLATWLPDVLFKAVR